MIEDSKPCSHAVRDFFHVFGIDFVALQFAHNILAECGIIHDSKEGRAQFQVCDILHHVSAHTAVDVFDMAGVSAVRDVDVLWKTFDIHKNCS